MKERPILFSAPMVRAILDGTKTQTRRVVNPPPREEMVPVVPEPRDGGRWVFMAAHGSSIAFAFGDVRCPFGVPGDRLWVRETWGLRAHHDVTDWHHGPVTGLADLLLVEYRADWERGSEHAVWRPSIHMRRADSRITLEITNVRVERLQAITEEDARAEGCPFPNHTCAALGDFVCLWESINGRKAPWSSNPWCWVLTFRRVTP